MTSAITDQAERDRIHTELDRTLFVEAGAGTGKTRELIERIVRLVATGTAELPEIAAITFTEAAAAELQERIRTRLEDAARDASLPDGERRRCDEAAGQIDAAAIETLHAFAQRILTDHPLEARLPPVIEVQDDIRASIAFQERWTLFVDELFTDPALEQPLLRAFVLGLDLGDLRDVARIFHENWDRIEDLDLAGPPLAPVSIEPVVSLFDEALALRHRCTDPGDRLVERLLQVEAYRERLRDAEDDLDRLRELLDPISLKVGNVGNKVNWRCPVDDVRDPIRRAGAEIERIVGEARAAVLAHLLDAIRRFVLRYADERRRDGRLEFHDLLVQARDLLRNDAAVRRDVRERYRRLLIDEFQDTDPLQIEIASYIAAREVDGPARPWHEMEIEDGRLFFVGDPKQSIYRFRRADIALYRRAQRLFAASTVHLRQNFRSVRPAVAWVNDLFSQLMAGGADGQAPYVPLEPSRPAQRRTPAVHLLGDGHDDNLPEVRRLEAAEIARVIARVKAELWQVSETVDGEPRLRDADYADIAVLFPTRTALPAIEEALEGAGVPYRVESQSLVYNTQEVRDLLSVLRAIDDPTDQVALIAALRSPAFACADDDLFRHRRAGGAWNYRLDPPDALPPGDPVAAAMRSLHELHRRRWWDTISGIVDAVIRERRLFELAFAHRRPRERWQRLRFILDQARAFSEAGGRTLRQFIDWAERQGEEGTRVVETAVPEPDDDAVRMMTVHAAKGLEFPIVLLAGLNIQQGRGRTDPVVWDAGGRPEVDLGGKGFVTPGYDAARDHDDELERQEKVRLLYVAATRARDHLIVSVHHKRDTSSHAKDVLERAMQARDLWSPADVRELAAPRRLEAYPPAEASPAQRDAWLARRTQAIEALARAPRWSAVDLAKAAAGDGDAGMEKDAPAEELPPWRRGRAGTAIGRAVHATLQSIDLATGDGLEGAARAQAAAENVPGRAGEVERLVRAALASDAVREAVSGGRFWRELFVSARIDGVALEGFIDLLYETPDGLVVVDYKTDRLRDGEAVDAAAGRYGMQMAAYAVALEELLGRPVARCVLIFVQPAGSVEREISNLDEARRVVRQRLTEAQTPSPSR